MQITGVEDHGGKPVDGVALVDVLEGDTTEINRELFFYEGQQGPHAEKIAVLTPQWKLVILGPNIARGIEEDNTIMLFRIDQDPHEQTNVAADNPAVVDELTQRLVAFRRLQPKNGVPPFLEGRAGFKTPKDWRIPDR